MYRSIGEQELQSLYGTRQRALQFYDRKVFDHLNSIMRDFIADQELMFIATSDQNGHCDSSFRAGQPGFVRCPDEKTLFYPEYSGNGVLASLGNIKENPHIGLLFIDFLTYKIGLHVNGSAKVVENEEVVQYKFQDDKATRWVQITVDEAYIHCSKNIPLMKKVDHPTDQLTSGDFFGLVKKADEDEAE
jgi:uncharacterized protein